MEILLDQIPPPKKNNRVLVVRRGKPISFPSKRYREWEKDALKQIKLISPPKVNPPVAVEIVYLFNDYRRRDLTNLTESVMDMLVRAGVLKDDACDIVRKVIISCDHAHTAQTIVRITEL